MINNAPKKKKWIVAGIIATLLTCFGYGCSRSESSAKTIMGSHHVTVTPRGHSTMEQFSDETSFYFYASGNTDVQIAEGRLVVDNMEYGELKKGESVFVDHGVVFISGSERSGTPLPLDQAPTKNSTANVGGYRVIVRPGASQVSLSKSRWGNTHEYIVGKTCVKVKKDRLFVNGIPYGKLGSSDAVLVEYKDVYISGKKRSVVTD